MFRLQPDTNPTFENTTRRVQFQIIEKGISIEYPYNFGLPLGNSAFVMVWLEFDLFVRTIVQDKGNER